MSDVQTLKKTGCESGCTCLESDLDGTFEKFTVAGSPGDEFSFTFRTLEELGGEETYKNIAFFMRGNEGASWSELAYKRGSASGEVTLPDDATGLYIGVLAFTGTGCEERNACQWYGGAWDLVVCPK